ncbi:hypothetical protein BDZ89DRAFT_1087533, partial [Hymenopellis radicata]
MPQTIPSLIPDTCRFLASIHTITPLIYLSFFHSSQSDSLCSPREQCTYIALAQSILNELLRAFEARDVQAATTSLERIRDEIKYTLEMGQKLSHSLVFTVKQWRIPFPDNQTIATIYWWTIPDVPTTNPSTITFKDTTGDDEDWGASLLVPPTPSTWLTPSIPPAYRHLDALKADSTSFRSYLKEPLHSASFRSYLKVPLLNFPGTGKEILPSMNTPPLVVSDVYLPVEFNPSSPPYLSTFDIGFDHVRPQDKLVPPLTTEQVLSLLGRVIEFSIAPLDPDPASEGNSKEARKKRRKLYKDLDPSTAYLYCLHISGSVNTVLILDISKPRSFGPFRPKVNVCQWLGVASLPEDQWALEQDGNAPAPAASAGSAKVDYGVYGKHLQAIVDRLNQTSEHHIFEVKNDSDILIGDTHLSKEHLNFEIVLENIALGVWMSASNDDNEDTLSVTMHWVGEGSVDWTNPSPVAHQDESGGEWESLGHLLGPLIGT